MLSSKSCVLFLLLPWTGYFGSHHYGLTRAKDTQNRYTPPIKTSLTVQIESSTNMVGLGEDVASETVTTNFETKAIYFIVNASSEQKALLEMLTASPEYSREPWATKKSSALEAKAILPTSHVHYSLASYVASSITVPSEPSKLNFSIQPSRVVNFTRNLTSTFQGNSTAAPLGSKNPVDNGCTTEENGKNSCDTYVTRWVDFYLNIGGWIMLAVVLVGIMVLVATHIHGRERRKEFKRLPAISPMRTSQMISSISAQDGSWDGAMDQESKRGVKLCWKLLCMVNQHAFAWTIRPIL